MVRGLVAAGATSPLLNHYLVAANFETWAEAYSTATCEGRLYCLAYDPIEGRLKRREDADEPSEEEASA